MPLIEPSIADRRADSTWHALYTRCQHEKAIARVLSNKGFEVFLPLYAATHQWKDRSKQVPLPLFPCYVFIHGGLERGLHILTPSGILGRVVASSGVTLEGVPIPNEGTILAGDLLMTPKGGTALVKFSSTTQANIAEETSVRFAYAGSNPLAQISSGTMVTTTMGKDALIVETPKYRIEPAAQGKATHVVAVLPDERTVVEARHGGVSITEISSGQRYILPEGNYAEIAASSVGVPPQEKQGDQQGSVGGGPKKRGGGWHIGSLSHKASIIFLSATAGAAAAIAIPLAVRGPVSPSKP